MIFGRKCRSARQWAYFDHAAVSPISGPAHRAIARWNEDAVANGDAYYPGWMRQLNEARQRSAQLIHAQPEEIALVANTTAGIGLVAEGYPWKEGDNAVLPDNEFPSNQYPWLNLISRGVEIRRVPTEGGRVPLEALGPGLRCPHASRQRQLGLLLQRLAAGLGPPRGNGSPSGRIAVPGCYPRTRYFSLGRRPHGDRLPCRRRPQVAAGTGRGRDFLYAPRASRFASPRRCWLEQRGPRPRFHPHRTQLQEHGRAL